MVEGIRGLHGATGPGKLPKKKKRQPRSSSVSQPDSVEISEGAKMAGSLSRFIQFAQAAPDIRVESVNAARAHLEQGVLFTDEVIDLATERFVQHKTGLKKK
jgi:hypothetical protein